MSLARGVAASLLVPLIAACLLAGARPASGLPFEVTIKASHSQRICFTNGSCPIDQSDMQSATGLSTDPTVEVETLATLSSNEGSRFFTRTGGPSEPIFVSALARADGFYGVGASGTTGLAIFSIAQAKFEFSVTNTDSVERDLIQTLGIEPIRLASWVGGGAPGQGEFGARPHAEIFARVTRILADGTEAETFEPYSYRVGLDRDPDLGNLFNVFFSDDLAEVLRRQDEAGNPLVGSEIFRIFVDENGNPATPPFANEILGVEIDAFTDQQVLITLQPEEVARIEVFGVAVVARDFEQGGEAFIGDPFSLDLGTPGTSTGLFEGGAAFELRPVPEPGTAFLLASALLVFGSWAGLRKALLISSVGRRERGHRLSHEHHRS